MENNSTDINVVVAFPLNGNYLHVQTGMGCYIDFTATDAQFKEIDGGQYDVDNISVYDTVEKMVKAVLDFMNWEKWGDFTITDLTIDQIQM